MRQTHSGIGARRSRRFNVQGSEPKSAPSLASFNFFNALNGFSLLFMSATEFAKAPPSPQRVVSVDALRGFDMFWIMGGDLMLRSLPKIHDSAFTRALAGQMEHCEWAGFHFYDLIFPLFVFLVGVSIPFSIPRMIESRGLAATVRRIVFRSVVLFLLGIFYMGGMAAGLKNVYLAGVLHRIAVAYFFTALIFCFLGSRSSGRTEQKLKIFNFRVVAMAVLCFILLVGYWALMTFVPVPGIGHQHGDASAHDFVDAKAEDSLASGVEAFDRTFRVDGE